MTTMTEKKSQRTPSLPKIIATQGGKPPNTERKGRETTQRRNQRLPLLLNNLPKAKP